MWRRGTGFSWRYGLGLVSEAEAPFEVGAPWGWEYGMSGAGSAVRGIVRWCWVERGVAVERGPAGWWAAEATPLDFGEEAPLEVAAEALLKLEGEWERMGEALAGRKVASSSGIGRKVG